MTLPKVHYAELLPHEFRQRLAEKPIAYLPLGTLEWHGEHLPLGADAIQSDGLMTACARQLGGIVMPPIHLGPDLAVQLEDGKLLYGMDYFQSTTPPQQLAGSCYWIPAGFFKSLLDAILAQLERAGFKAVFADGHGPSRWSWAEDIPEREKRFGLKLFGVTADIHETWKSQMDHAGRNETSLMLHYRPDLVDLSQLSQDPANWPQAVAGQDPRQATSDLGREFMAACVEIIKKMFAEAGL